MIDFFWARWILSILLLILILWLPPMDLNEELQMYSRSIQNSIDANTAQAKLLFEEHKKATDEILKRIEHGNDWFKWKFLVIGAVFVGAFTFVGLTPSMFSYSRNERANTEESTRINADTFLIELLSSHYLLNILAVSFILSLVIDIHGRHNIVITNQLGLWITYFVEPTFYGKPFPSYNYSHDLVGWEQFIRLGKGIHTDLLSSITTWTLLHFLTIILYGAYLVVLRYFPGSQCRKDPLNYRSSKNWLTKSCFYFIYLSIVIFCFAGHSIPGNVHFVVFKWPLEALEMTLVTLIFTGFLFLLALPEHKNFEERCNDKAVR